MSLELSYKIKEYSEPVIFDADSDSIGQDITYRDYVKLDEPYKGKAFLAYLYGTKKDKRLWAFADPTNIHANRYLQVTPFITLSQIEATTDDYKTAFTRIKEHLQKGETDKALSVSQSCETVLRLTDPIEKYLSLATVFLFFDDENPIYYDNKLNKDKLSLFKSLPQAEKVKLAEWVREYFDRSVTNLISSYPECFVETGDDREFFEVLNDLVDKNKDMENFIAAVTQRSLMERDRLMMYNISDLYRDMSIFIRNADKIG